jgi:hypothetical protein
MNRRPIGDSPRLCCVLDKYAMEIRQYFHQLDFSKAIRTLMGPSMGPQDFSRGALDTTFGAVSRLKRFRFPRYVR